MNYSVDPNAIAIARDIARVRRSTADQARASQASRRSVELGFNQSGVNYYKDGERIATVGLNYDGDFVISRNPEVSPTPPMPSAPFATGRIGGVEIAWDGTFESGVEWSGSIARVEIHALAAPGNPTSDATQIGTFLSKLGGAKFYSITAAAGELYYCLQVVSVAEVESAVSFTSPATAIDAVDAEMWQEHEDALILLNTVTLPALQDEVDDNATLIQNLTTSIIPDLQADLDAAEAAVATRVRVIFNANQPAGLTADDRVIWYETDNGNAASYWDGVAWGPYSLGAGALAADSVTAIQIAAGAVTATEIGADAVIAAKIQAGAVVAGKIAADAVTATTIAADAVTAVKIQAGAVTAGKIAADAVTATTIAAGAVVAGKLAANAVTATNIAAEAVTAGKIAVGAVTAGTIAAGSITTTELNAAVLSAGFVLTGAIQVGVSYWSAEDGIVLPQPDGSTTRFPSDGVTAAQFAGHANLKSATVEGNLNILGATNKVSGLVKLANGIVEPTVAPSVFQSWPSVYSSVIDGSSTAWRIYHGMCPHHSNAALFAVAINYGGAGIRFVDKTTGATGAFPDPTSGKAWATDFYPGGGIGYASGHYYIYGVDHARADAWYIYKIDSVNYNKIAEYNVGAWNAHASGNPALAVDAANSIVYLFWNEGNLGKFATWNLNLGLISASATFNDYGIPVDHDSAWVGAGDFGATRVFLGIGQTNSFVSFIRTGMVFDAAASFSYPEGGISRGIYYDTAVSRFRTYDRNGKVFLHSSWKTSQLFTSSYTWYDGDGTARETMEGPNTSFTLPPRAHLNVETSVPPDSGNTDPLQVDKANRVGIYVGVGAGLRKLQSRLGVDGSGVSIRRLTMDTVSTGTANVPASNTFIGGTTSTGKIVSAAESGGIPLLSISGDGKINSQLIEDTGWIAVTFQNGWTNLGAPWQTMRYKRRNGVVYVEGTMVPGTNGNPAFTLPAGFRPAAAFMVTGQSNTTSAVASRVDVEASGVVRPQGAVTWCGLSFSFIAA